MQQNQTTPDRAPAWVGLFLRVSRPVIPATVLVMSAPQERALAQLVGWSERTSWGMAVILATYGAVAAVVATYVPRDSSWWWPSTIGAAGAVGVAMGAQVTGHLIVTGWLDVTPVPVWLVVAASCAPGAVLAHVMHLSWVKVPSAPMPSLWPRKPQTAPQGPDGGPGVPSAPEDENGPQTAAQDPEAAPADPVPDHVPEWLTVKEAAMRTGRDESTVRGWVFHNKVKFEKHENGRVSIQAESLPAAIATPIQEEIPA